MINCMSKILLTGVIITHLMIDYWIDVCSQYEGCCNTIPEIEIVDKLPCNLKGAYLQSEHKIKLSGEHLNMNTVYHEMHHACGSTLGEVCLPRDCWGD